MITTSLSDALKKHYLMFEDIRSEIDPMYENTDFTKLPESLLRPQSFLTGVDQTVFMVLQLMLGMDGASDQMIKWRTEEYERKRIR